MRRAFFCWLTALAVATCILLIVLLFAPPFRPSADFTFPENTQDAVRILAKLLTDYARDHEYYLHFFYLVLFTYLRIFTIPGKRFLRAVSGAMYDVKKAMLLNWVSSLCGATGHYSIAYYCLSPYLEQAYAKEMGRFRHQVKARKGRTFWYVLSLTFVPFLPSWWITSGCAVVGIPLHTLLAATAIGALPTIYLEVVTGALLKELHTTGAVMPQRVGFLLLAVALFVGLPAYYFDDTVVDETDHHLERILFKIVIPGRNPRLRLRL